MILAQNMHHKDEKSVKFCLFKMINLTKIAFLDLILPISRYFPQINQSINVYSFQQPYLIFQEKKAFTVATLEVSQASKSVNMHRDLKLSYIRWCDKLGISTTTVANIEMVPRTLGVNS